MDAWTIGRRFVRVKTLEEGVIFIGSRPTAYNSESSENTDNTATTTTSTLPSRTLTLVSIHHLNIVHVTLVGIVQKGALLSPGTKKETPLHRRTS